MSSEALVLPSFNRFFPQVVSQSPSGIIAYGCRNIIYFIDARCYPPVVLDSKCILRAYKEKVAALSFCKCKSTELIASISDCGEVKVWDINTGTSINNFSVKEGIVNIEWIHGSSNTVVFPQDSKILVKWNFNANIVSKIKFGSELNTCFITSNEKCPNLLAVGHNNGTITVVDIVQEKVLHKYKDHIREINMLTWSPVLPDILLSVGCDYSVRTWKMGEEKSTKLYWIGRAKPDERKRIRALGICHPIYADVMICSNTYGEIGEVSLSDEKPRFKAYSKRTMDVYCRCLLALFSGTLNTEEGAVNILYCFDSYVLSVWNINEKKLITFLPFFLGFVYDLSFSPVNPIYLSICNGDGIVRVWNSQADSQISRMISVFVQAKTKIMTAAWHPILENVIAFGTDDGKLGIIDTIKKKSQYPFETYHKGKVYCVCWGPCKSSSIEDAENGKYFIYSCGGGNIYINRHKRLKEKALNFHEIATQPIEIEAIENTCSEIIWKSDFSCVCIGTYKGFIDLYSDELVFLARYNLEMKSIEGLRWHPENTYMSPNGSPLKFWLACCGNDPNIYIVNTSKMLEEKMEASTDCIVKKLIGHKKPVNATCWSPHIDEYLVSASKDGSALVWNVSTGNIIASFLNHSDVVNSVQWSVFDEDVIYSGGQDNCVRVWRISRQSSVAPADKAPSRKKLRRPKPVLKTIEKSQDSEEEIISENETAVLKKEISFLENSETDINKDGSSGTVENENAEVVAPDTYKKKKHSERFIIAGKRDQALWLTQYSKKSESLFRMSPKSVTEDDLKDCMGLVDFLHEKSDGVDGSFDPLKPDKGILSDEDALKFGLYTDQSTTLRMADIQGGLYKSRNDITHFCQISVMTNKVENLLKEAADNGTLSSYLVSLSPSVSYSFWLEMCEKFALQLLQEQQPFVACTYFLMCNKIYEAIDVLKEKGKIIDALALAKLRLPESDPVISNLLHLIRKRCHDLSNKLGEVKCYLSLNDILLAVKALGSMPDARCVKIAAYICKKHNMSEEAEKYMFIFLQRCLMQCDWEAFKEFADQEPSLQVYDMLFTVHEAFYVHLCELKKQSGFFVTEIFSLPNSEEFVKFWNGTTSIDTDKCFLEYVFDVLTSKKLLPSTESSLETIIQSLDTFSSKWNALESSSDAHVAIAIFITRFILLTSVGDSAAGTTNFLKIFETSNNIVYLPKIVFMLFLPMNLLWSGNMKNIVCKSKVPNLKDGTNMVFSQYGSIVECVVKKIGLDFHPLDLNIVSKDGLQNNLRSLTEQIASKLSSKEIGEFVLVYFVSYMVHDLSRLLNKKILVFECHAKKTHFIDKDIPSETLDEILQENSLINNNEGTDIQKEESSELKALIESALKEADEKIQTLTSSQPRDTSNNLSPIKDLLSSCSIKVSTNDEKICEEVGHMTDKECGNVSNDDYYVEIPSSETPLNIANCIVPVSCSDENSHAQCLASIDLFYHLTLFILSNVCKEEFTLLHYLKEHLKSLQLARASFELSKFSIGNKVHLNTHCSKVESSENANKTKTDLSTTIQSNQSVNGGESTSVLTNQIKADKDGNNEIESSDSTIESISTNSNFDKSAGYESKNGNSDTELINQVPLNDQELNTVISNDHNYSSQLKDGIPSKETLESSNENVVLEDLSELIHLLELKTKGISYPSPLEIIPKVLQILYDARKKSTCDFIQEKLHTLIDDIVQWAETFQISTINFVCEICC